MIGENYITLFDGQPESRATTAALKCLHLVALLCKTRVWPRFNIIIG